MIQGSVPRSIKCDTMIECCKEEGYDK